MALDLVLGLVVGRRGGPASAAADEKLADDVGASSKASTPCVPSTFVVVVGVVAVVALVVLAVALSSSSSSPVLLGSWRRRVAMVS